MVLGWLIGRLGDKSEEITGVERTVRRVGSGGGSRAGSAMLQQMRSFGNLEDFAVLRRHALNALCGAVMDRRSDCEKESHPFCGPGHVDGGDGSATQFIAQAVPNQDTAGGDLIGVYISPAKGQYDGSGQQDILEYMTSLTPLMLPTQKLVVSPPTAEGWYPAYCGAVTHQGTDLSYPTGQLDQKRAFVSVNCAHRPEHCKWEYFDNELAVSGRLVPTFHCLQFSAKWWVAEVDAASGAAQAVAALDFADDPKHGTASR